VLPKARNPVVNGGLSSSPSRWQTTSPFAFELGDCEGITACVMDWGGGKDDEDRGFRQYSGPFSFDTPLFDITTPLDLADAYGDGDDNSEEASPPPFPSYARQPKPTFRRGREDAMNVDTAPRFSSGYSTAFVPDQGFPTFTGVRLKTRIQPCWHAIYPYPVPV
jgi:hypothetical protein